MCRYRYRLDAQGPHPTPGASGSSSGSSSSSRRRRRRSSSSIRCSRSSRSSHKRLAARLRQSFGIGRLASRKIQDSSKGGAVETGCNG